MLQAWGFETSLTLGTLTTQFSHPRLEICACHSVLPCNFVSQRGGAVYKDVKQLSQKRSLLYGEFNLPLHPPAPVAPPQLGVRVSREALSHSPPEKGKIKAPLGRHNYSRQTVSFALDKRIAAILP